MRKIVQKLSRLALAYYALGFLDASRYLFFSLMPRTFKGRAIVNLGSPLSACALVAELGSSDIDVFYQIYIKREYRELPSSQARVRWIVDCGANVGYATAYFATKHNNANIVAIEPDPRNFKLLQKNVLSFGKRVHLLEGGVWGFNQKLKLGRNEFMDGREWATQTRPAIAAEEPDVDVYGIDSIMERYGIDEIDILKIDIEGAELSVFSEGVEEWLPSVKQLVVELHGKECALAFYRAMKKMKQVYEFKSSGELIFATRID